MPTPSSQRPIPPHVEIPDLPEDLARAWSDLLERAQSKDVRWRRRELNLAPVLDGRSAARELHGYRYIGSGWVDQASDAPGAWRPGWIVLADRDGDPVIADLTQPDVPILSAPHGAGTWRTRRAHDSFADFIAAIKVTEPKVYKPYIPPEPPPRDSSLTVLDWGPDRDTLVAELVRRMPNMYQAHMFVRKVEVPVVLTRRYYGDTLHNIARFIESHGGAAQVGPAIEKPKQPPEG